MQRRIMSALWSKGGGSKHHRLHQLRQMVTVKSSNRASVHGTRLPIPDQVDKKQVEKDIMKAKEEKEKKRKEIEKIVNSELKKLDIPLL